MPDNPTPEMLKRMKLDTSQGASSSASEHTEPSAGPSKSRAATVEEVEDEEMGGTDRDFAPGGDADYFVEEDEEGRFYGGGLTSEQKEILNIFDKDVSEGVREDVSVHIVSVVVVISHSLAGRHEHPLHQTITPSVRACCKQEPGPAVEVARRPHEVRMTRSAFQ